MKRALVFASGGGMGVGVRHFSTTTCLLSTKKKKDTGPELVKETLVDGVTLLRMNRPSSLNAWTPTMMDQIKVDFELAAKDDATRVLVLTGTDPYYCAGVNLAGGLMKPMMPASLCKFIATSNQAWFDLFLDFPKPLIAAVNGPAIGASVTSATLCDAIVASENATFHTPFTALGITPEGCSSIHFERIMGAENATRMLGKEGWKPTAKEAADAGFVTHVAPHGDAFTQKIIEVASEWKGKERTIISKGTRAELKAVNARESERIAHAFLDVPFLKGQETFLKSKGKSATAFTALLATRPIWSRML